MHKTVLLSALLFALNARAEDAQKPAEAVQAAAAPAQAAPQESRPYVEAAVSFLKGLTHTARSGDAGEEAWAEARSNAAEKVSFKVAGKELALDLGAKKADAQLVRFQKISTLREAGAVKGVTLENIEARVDGQPHSGKATLLMEEKDGKWLVTSIEID